MKRKLYHYQVFVVFEDGSTDNGWMNFCADRNDAKEVAKRFFGDYKKIHINAAVAASDRQKDRAYL